MTKLIFAGLDAAGKTTIYKATMKEMPAEQLKGSKPTRGIERNITDFMDIDFAVWDLGGQKSYRETYLSKPEVFNSTKALIFVVDIQDVDRFEEAYQYYLDIMNILINVEPKPKVYVLFHKFDPDKAAQLRSHFFRATKLFRQADAQTGMKFTGFATSIFSDTIQKAVKRILWENLDNYNPNLEVKEKTAPPTPSVPKIGGNVTKPPSTTGTPTAIPKPSEKPSAPAPTSDFLGEKLSDKIDPLLSDVEKEVETVSSRQSSEPKIEKAPAPTPAPSPKPAAAPTHTSASAPAPTPVQVEKKAEQTKPIETEKPSSAKPIPSPVYKEGEIYEEVPDLSDLSTHIVDQLSNVISKRMNETPEIVALAILSVDGKVPLAVAKSEMDREKIEIVKQVVQALSPRQFFKDLGDVEYRGLGHLTVSNFDIYFAKLQDEYAIAILAVDVSTAMLENAQRIVKTIRQGLGMVPKDKSEAKEEEEEPKDLIGDLRSRLKRLSSLHNVDE